VLHPGREDAALHGDDLRVLVALALGVVDHDLPVERGIPGRIYS
jgi:hypothetical protein